MSQIVINDAISTTDEQQSNEKYINEENKSNLNYRNLSKWKSLVYPEMPMPVPSSLRKTYSTNLSKKGNLTRSKLS